MIGSRMHTAEMLMTVVDALAVLRECAGIKQVVNGSPWMKRSEVLRLRNQFFLPFQEPLDRVSS